MLTVLAWAVGTAFASAGAVIGVFWWCARKATRAANQWEQTHGGRGYTPGELAERVRWSG